MALTLLDRLKGFMELDINDTEQDVLLEIALDASISLLEHYCNMSITSSTKTVILDGTGTDKVDIDSYPISDIVSITIDGTDYAVVDFYDDRNYIVALSTVFPIGRRNITITVTAGYPTDDDIPADLLLAILKLSEKIYTDASENREGVKGYNTSNKVSEDFTHQDWPTGVLEILKGYKRYVI